MVGGEGLVLRGRFDFYVMMMTMTTENDPATTIDDDDSLFDDLIYERTNFGLFFCWIRMFASKS